ncbi:MAG: beta-galactosidase [Anaerolineae bacterium]|nr:beta-galactosidase [Anaerolineae bacterium]
MPRIAASPGSLLIDGQPALIQAGALHYSRLPSPSLWEPVLQRIRMAGMNAVFVPCPWSYHSPAPGFHDFTGPRDLGLLVSSAEQLGLWLIPAIGPWLGLGLDGGGVPAWLHRTAEAQPILAAAAGSQPARPYLRAVAAWWEQLLPRFLDQPNLLLVALHPGLTADGQELAGYVHPLLDLARRLGVAVPIAVPGSCWTEIAGTSMAGDVLPWFSSGPVELARRGAPLDGATGEAVGLVVVDISLPPSRAGKPPAQMSQVGGLEHPRPLVTGVISEGHPVVVLDPFHRGVNWGHWAAPGDNTLYGYGAPLAELAAPTKAYENTRRLAMTLETLAPLLVTGAAPPRDRRSGSLPALATGAEGDRLWTGLPDMLDGAGAVAPSVQADPTRVLAWSRRRAEGTLVALVEDGGSETLVQLALGDSAEDEIVVEDIPLGAGEVRMLPLDWQLVEGRLMSTTLEPVLHTVVAGRELVILRNDKGGELLLPPDFRHRHSRGPVFVDRTPAASGRPGVALHVDPARIASAVLDGPGGHALQILALAPEWAACVWPLDDAWRTMPTYPARWTPIEEAPARGVVIGPDFVVPEADGGFRFLAAEKGFGYRWGPWRGSDPHTWLSPLTWSAAPAIALPVLRWESLPGAAEALPGYDDRSWRALSSGALLTAEALDVDCGFIWYRAHFEGTADAVTLACPHACDLFLNGEHVAALSPPPDGSAVAPKTLPLPVRHLREHNVLALLVEHQGRDVAWDTAAAPHGLIAFELVGAQVRTWRVRAGLSGEVQRQGFYGFADGSLIGNDASPLTARRDADARGAEPGVLPGYGHGTIGPHDGAASGAVTWHRTGFSLNLPHDVEAPVFLVLDQTPTKCAIYLNGLRVGELWYPQRAERRFWLPEGILRRDGPNELLVAQWTRGATPGIGVARLESAPPAIWHHQLAV